MKIFILGVLGIQAELYEYTYTGNVTNDYNMTYDYDLSTGARGRADRNRTRNREDGERRNQRDKNETTDVSDESANLRFLKVCFSKKFRYSIIFLRLFRKEIRIMACYRKC